VDPPLETVQTVLAMPGALSPDGSAPDPDAPEPAGPAAHTEDVAPEDEDGASADQTEESTEGRTEDKGTGRR
jgi:hypothetical protein